MSGAPAPVIERLCELAVSGRAMALFSALEATGGCASPIWVHQVPNRYRRRHLGGRDGFEEAVAINCGTRRATRCVSCAERYRGDARQLVMAGLAGGKGLSAEVGDHPAVFATLTAPGFGAVHRRCEGAPCHKGPAKSRCSHGRTTMCEAEHQEDDPVLGQALCAACYDYEGAVLWNSLANELWRRTSIYLRRHLAATLGTTARELDAQVRISYLRVVEYQRRGSVHFHVIVRADGISDGGLCEPPPAVSAPVLATALRQAAQAVSVGYPDGSGRQAHWGEQLDVQVLATGSPEGRRVVGLYLAKYATKSSDDAGALDHRLRSEADLERRELSPQLRRMAEAAWRLGGRLELVGLRLRPWAHMLGFRGHFLTKSARFSTTFSALRAERLAWRLAQLDEEPSAVASAGPASWVYLGGGWAHPAEAWLATRWAEERRRLRQVLWEEREPSSDLEAA